MGEPKVREKIRVNVSFGSRPRGREKPIESGTTVFSRAGFTDQEVWRGLPT